MSCYKAFLTHGYREMAQTQLGSLCTLRRVEQLLWWSHIDMDGFTLELVYVSASAEGRD